MQRARRVLARIGVYSRDYGEGALVEVEQRITAVLEARDSARFPGGRALQRGAVVAVGPGAPCPRSRAERRCSWGRVCVRGAFASLSTIYNPACWPRAGPARGCVGLPRVRGTVLSGASAGEPRWEAVK